MNTQYGSTGDFCSVFSACLSAWTVARGRAVYTRRWRSLISLCTDSLSRDSWERNWVMLGGFPGLPTPLLSSFFPLLVSVCIRCDNSNHKRSSSLQGSYNWIWLAVTTNRAKYRLSGMLLGLFSSSQNLDQSEIRLRGTCFVSDAHCILDTWWQSWHRLAR